MPESFESIALRVDATVNANAAQGGLWGPAFLDLQAPVFKEDPAGDPTYAGLFGELSFLGRYGNWTGSGYGAGHLSPSFDFASFDLTDAGQRAAYEAELARFRPGGEFWLDPSSGYRDEFDRLSRAHDLLYQDANLAAAESYRLAGAAYAAGSISAAELLAARDLADEAHERSMREADVWLLERSGDVSPTDPIGIVVKSIDLAIHMVQTEAYYLGVTGSFPTRAILHKVGEMFGSRLGQIIGGENSFAQIVGHDLGIYVGEELADYFAGKPSFELVESLLETRNGVFSLSFLFDEALMTMAAQGIVGTLAVAELTKLANAALVGAAEALGLEGYAEYVFIETGEAIGTYLKRIATSGDVSSLPELFERIDADFDFSDIGNFLVDLTVKFLASEINDFIDSLLDKVRGLVEIDSFAESVFAEIGSLIGAFIGNDILPIIGGKIGETIGYILGSIVFEALDFITFGLIDGIIGLFVDDPEPQSWYFVGIDPDTGHLSVIHSAWKKDGIDVDDILQIHDGNRQLNDAYMGFVNGVIDAIGGVASDAFFHSVVPDEEGNRIPGVDFRSHATIAFHTDGYYVDTYWGGSRSSGPTSNDPVVIIERAIAFELAHLIFYGGDLAQVRALNSWEATLAAAMTPAQQLHYQEHRNLPVAPADSRLELLAANLQIAQEYRYYLDNAATINFLMSQAPTSPFTLGWLATLARAAELGLNAPYVSWPDGGAGTAGNDVILSADGNDVLFGDAGADTIRAYGGDDTVYGGEDADSIYGGTGRDLLLGDAGDDQIDAGEGDDRVYGGEGDDTLHGRRGADLLLGDTGNDHLFGGDGADSLFGWDGNDRISGEEGDDQIAGEAGNDILDGGAGNDILFGDLPDSAGEDIISGGAGDDIARGGGGHDVISGEDGADRLYGDSGDDLISGGAGSDRIEGGAGDDEIDGGDDSDRVLGGGGRDRILGGGGDDQLFGLGEDDIIEGGAGVDSLFGDLGDDDLAGGAGDDRLGGWIGADRLSGDAGDDLLAGEDGNDVLSGGSGDDVLYGDREPLPPQTGFSAQEIIDRSNARIGAGDFTILYQGPSYDAAGLAAADHDLLIINPAETVDTNEINSEELWSSATVDAIESGGKLLVAYLNLAKINDFTNYWDPLWTDTHRAEGTLADDAPCFLSEDDPGFSHTRLVNFWETEWRDLMLARVEEIIDHGFSGLFLDDVLEYYVRRGDTDAGRAQAAREMRDLVIEIAEAARGLVEERSGSEAADRFVIIVNGAPFLIDDTSFDGSVPQTELNDRFYASIDAFLAENYFSQDLGYAIDQAVEDYGARGIALLSVDTDIATEQQRIQIEQSASAAGFLPEVVPDFEYGTDSARFVVGFGDQPAPGNDLLEGGDGNDALFGQDGADILRGGSGDDLLDGGAGSDFASYSDAAGAVTVDLRLAAAQATGGAGSDTLAGIENLQGSAFADVLTGTASANLIDGGGGADLLVGNAGDDWYFVDHAADAAVENSGEGFDRVLAGTSFALASGTHVEMLTTANNLATTAISLTGNAFAQYLYGNAGSNQLDGGGGGDVMYGFEGDDFYVVRAAGDRAVEAAGGGTDRVFAMIDFALEAGSYVELLTTIDNSATAQISLTGNALSQYLYGNAGSNQLDGGGGGDVMTGFEGNDFYIARAAGDRAVEAAGGGTDRVFAMVDFALEAGSHVELLTTIDNAATTAISLTGNALAQYLYGNAGSNQLDGGGGGDVMTGFEGNDFYIVRAAGDRAVEAAGGGTDRVFAAVSFALEAGSEVEMLTTIDNSAATAINLAGNAVDQYLYGNAGANILDGKGGADVMTGFGGADSFAFTSALGGGNVDRIGDFSSLDDTILLDDAIFVGLATGALNADAFAIGSQAADASDRIIYNSTTGALLFDADGSGAGAAIQFATVDGAPFIAAGDFQVI